MNNKLHSLLSFCNIFHVHIYLNVIYLVGESLSISFDLNDLYNVGLISRLFFLALDEHNFLPRLAEVGVLGDLVHHFDDGSFIERADFMSNHTSDSLELLHDLLVRGEG